ncbi:MAG: hypothetical protein ACE149_15690 [Armatimonadota bacterium]
MEIGLYYSLEYSAPETLRYASDLSCRWSYLSIDWRRIQPKAGVFTFDEYDRPVQDAQALGLQLIGDLSSAPGSFPDDHCIWRNSQGMMPDLGLWREYVSAIVNRYGDTIRCWEVWSEPNCRSCNPMSYYDAELYSRLLATTSKVIREIDSSARVIIGGLWLNSLTPDYVDALFRSGAADHFDIFNFHLYPMPPSRESIPFPLWRSTLSQWVDFFRNKLPEGCPIWMTEFGISTRTAASEVLYTRTRGEVVAMTEEEQADWFSGFAEAADEEWDLATVIWYRLRDVEDPTHYYAATHGILRPDGSAKPVRERIAQWQSARAASSREKGEDD